VTVEGEERSLAISKGLKGRVAGKMGGEGPRGQFGGRVPWGWRRKGGKWEEGHLPRNSKRWGGSKDLVRLFRWMYGSDSAQ